MAHPEGDKTFDKNDAGAFPTPLPDAWRAVQHLEGHAAGLLLSHQLRQGQQDHVSRLHLQPGGTPEEDMATQPILDADSEQFERGSN